MKVQRHWPPRSGSTLLIVLVLSVIASVGVMMFLTTSQHERRRTARLVQQTQAQYEAQRVLVKLAAILHSRPWQDRFYMQTPPGQMPDIPYAFSSRADPFRETSREFTTSQVFYQGFVKDLSAREQIYRVKLDVTYAGFKLHSTWDRRYSEGLLGNLNHDHEVVSKQLDLPELPPETEDRQLDWVRQEATRPEKQAASAEDQQVLRETADWEGNADDLRVAGLSREIEEGFVLPASLLGGGSATASARDLGLALEATLQASLEAGTRQPGEDDPDEPAADDTPTAKVMTEEEFLTSPIGSAADVPAWARLGPFGPDQQGQRTFFLLTGRGDKQLSVALPKSLARCPCAGCSCTPHEGTRGAQAPRIGPPGPDETSSTRSLCSYGAYAFRCRNLEHDHPWSKLGN